MNYREIKNKVIEIVVSQFSGYYGSDIDINSISINSTFKEVDKSFDDLDLIEIVMEVEDTFDLSIDDNVADLWETVNDIINYVYSGTEKDAEEINIEISRFEIMEL